MGCALVAVCWLVLLGGTAAVHDYRDSGKECPNALNCANSRSVYEEMRQVWWACWMEFFLLVLNIVALVIDADAWALVLCSVSAVATAVLMERAERWLLYLDGSNLNSDMEEAASAAAAGTIMCCIANFVLIILVGNSSFRGQATAKAEAAGEVVGAPA